MLIKVTQGDKTDQNEEMLLIPIDQVGSIIGKGGNMIREINTKSGATCIIGKDDQEHDGELFKKCHIRGSPTAIKKAKSLIKELFKEEEDVIVEHDNVAAIIGKNGNTI